MEGAWRRSTATFHALLTFLVVVASLRMDLTPLPPWGVRYAIRGRGPFSRRTVQPQRGVGTGERFPCAGSDDMVGGGGVTPDGVGTARGCHPARPCFESYRESRSRPPPLHAHSTPTRRFRPPTEAATPAQSSPRNPRRVATQWYTLENGGAKAFCAGQYDGLPRHYWRPPLHRPQYAVHKRVRIRAWAVICPCPRPCPSL